MTRNLPCPKTGPLWPALILAYSANSSYSFEMMIDTGQRASWSKLNRPKSCSASESLLWVLILDLSQRQPKRHLSWRITREGDFLTLWRDNQLDTCWYLLILVDTELTLDWFAQAPSKWWGPGVPLALTHHLKLLKLSVAISRKLFSSIQKSIWIVTEKRLGLSARAAFQCTS